MDSPFQKFATFPPAAQHQECINLMVGCIVEAVDPRRVILFGSRAREDNHPSSDVDLLVEMDGRLDPDELLDTAVRARISVADAPLPKDIVVLGSEQLADESACWHSVAHHALNEGQVLYARPR